MNYQGFTHLKKYLTCSWLELVIFSLKELAPTTFLRFF